MNYLNLLPLSLRVYLDESKDINLVLGPQIGFLRSVKEKGEERGFSVDKDLSDEMKTLDLSAVLGLGVDMPIGINFDARLNYGLTDIINLSKNYAPGFTRPKLTNIVFQFHVGYTFRKGE